METLLGSSQHSGGVIHTGFSRNPTLSTTVTKPVCSVPPGPAHSFTQQELAGDITFVPAAK